MSREKLGRYADMYMACILLCDAVYSLGHSARYAAWSLEWDVKAVLFEVANKTECSDIKIEKQGLLLHMSEYASQFCSLLTSEAGANVTVLYVKVASFLLPR